MPAQNSTHGFHIFNLKKGIVPFLLVLFLLAGIGIRLVDFTDLPLDSSSEQQLRTMIRARGIYFDTEEQTMRAAHQSEIHVGEGVEDIGLPVFEGLTAFTYRLIGGENILAGRVWSILFWVIGGIPFFLLARKLISVEGAFVALAFYLFVPSGVFQSRNFMPDPLAVMCLIWTLLFQFQWTHTGRWKHALLAVVFGCVVLLVKPGWIFFVLLPFAGLLLNKPVGGKNAWWIVAATLLPAALYFGLKLAAGGVDASRTDLAVLPRLYLDVDWYLDWLQMIKKAAGYFSLIIGLLALFLLPMKKDRALFGGLWLAYLLYGFFCAHAIRAQDHSQLPLLPILALGMGIAAAALFERLEETGMVKLTRVVASVLFVASLGLCLQSVIEKLNSYDYRQQGAYWRQVGEAVGMDSSVVALTQDNGYDLIYWGGVSADLWPTTPDLAFEKERGISTPDFGQRFDDLTSGKDYFLVTLPDELNLQPALNERLAAYPVQQAEGYLIYDLAHPLAEGN